MLLRFQLHVLEIMGYLFVLYIISKYMKTNISKHENQHRPNAHSHVLSWYFYEMSAYLPEATVAVEFTKTRLF